MSPKDLAVSCTRVATPELKQQFIDHLKVAEPAFFTAPEEVKMTEKKPVTDRDMKQFLTQGAALGLCSPMFDCMMEWIESDDHVKELSKELEKLILARARAMAADDNGDQLDDEAMARAAEAETLFEEAFEREFEMVPVTAPASVAPEWKVGSLSLVPGSWGRGLHVRHWGGCSTWLGRRKKCWLSRRGSPS